MIKQIKTKLIHLLGGKTQEECIGHSFTLGEECVLALLEDKAKTLYGKDAETWCKEMYEYISELQTNVEKQYGQHS